MQQFGQYRIEGIIGSGGMGEVYRAYDTRRDREVALKLLPTALSDDPEYQRRFQRESYAVARLREPHVIPIHDYGEIDDRLFIDMRLVDGPNLGELIARGGPLSPERAVGLVSQIAEALDAALEPRGVFVVIEAEHFCMTMRGIKKPGAQTVTSAVRGLFRTDARTRTEAMQHIGMR